MDLDALTHGQPATARLFVVWLHGHGMSPEDFAPFAPSLSVPAAFHLLRAPHALASGGQAWWARDAEVAARRGRPPWDLADERPPGREAVRRALARYLNALAPLRAGRPLLLAGFSQGGMLACDTVLHEQVDISALALLSSCRIAFDDWQPRLQRLAGLPVLVTHGRHDERLAFSAGEALCDAVRAGGADTEWLPFDGGHEVPLLAWRRLRVLMQRLIAQGGVPAA